MSLLVLIGGVSLLARNKAEQEWPVYHSDELELEVSYPPGWSVNTESGRISITPIAADDPIHDSSVGLASALTIHSAAEEDLQELERHSEKSNKQSCGQTTIPCYVLLTPNEYAGGYHKSFVFPTSPGRYLIATFYSETNYPFEQIVTTLRIEDDPQP